MLAVGDQPELVEARLLEGRLWCPSCADGVLGPRGFASEHELRCPDGRRRLRFRRARCRACKATHVLVPTSTLLRRLDMVEVIGAALLAKVAGLGHRRIAGALGRRHHRPRLLRRVGRRAAELWALAALLAHRHDPQPGSDRRSGKPER